MNYAMQQRIESGLTIEELVESHVAEFTQACKKRLSKDRLASLLVYHQREVREFQQYHAAKEMIAKSLVDWSDINSQQGY